MGARYILAVLSAVFLAFAASRLGRGSAAARGQARVWLMIGVMFGLVSAWLFYAGAS
jgi:hypothetical protein